MQTVLEVAAGDGHTLALVLTTDGEKVVVGWGSNREGQLGLSKPGLFADPTLLPAFGADQVRTLAASGNYTAAILEEENGLLLMGGDSMLADVVSGSDAGLMFAVPKEETVFVRSPTLTPPTIVLTGVEMIALSSTRAVALAGK